MKLADWIKAEGINAAEVARRLNCSVSSITRILRREMTVSPDMMRRIMILTDGAVMPNDHFPEAERFAGKDSQVQEHAS